MRRRRQKRPWTSKNTTTHSTSVSTSIVARGALTRAARALPGNLLGIRRQQPRVSHNTPFVSARYRLALVNLAIVSGILAIMMVAVYAWEARATDRQVNDQLTNWASHEVKHDSYMSLITDRDGAAAGTALPPEPGAADGERLEQYEPSSPNIFYAILDLRGHVVAAPHSITAIGMPNVAAVGPVLDGRQDSAFATVGHGESAYRLYTVAIHDEDENGKVIGVLQAGISLRARERQLDDLLLILAGAGAGALTLSCLASLFLADRALRPMRLAFARQRQFTAAASHELRTPLAIMRSQAEVLGRTLQRAAAYAPAHMEAMQTASALSRRETEHLSGTTTMADLADTGGPSTHNGLDEVSVQRMREDVAELAQEVDYMTRLTRDLLLLARDAGDNGQIEWKLLSLSAITRKTVAGLQAQAKEHSLTLHLATSAREASIYVRGDADRLRQVILALVENALRYTSTGGEVLVETRVAHGRRWLPGDHRVAQLVVTDTGRGIAPEDMMSIFEPFYRAPSVRTEPGGHDSAGLGLALVQWIVSAHGGDVSVSSRVGHGSTFTVSLPLAAQDAGEN